MVSTYKNESTLVVPDDAQTFKVTLGLNVAVLCHLQSEINAADLEIRWFKGTDCVCLYMEEQVIVGVDYKGRANLKMEDRDISLELEEFRESDDGVYLCQVTRGGKTEKIREVSLSLKTNESTETLQSENETLEKIDEMKMEKSVLMAVITELKETKQECKTKDAEIEKLKAQLPQTVGEPEENTQQENMHKPAQELDNSEFNQDNPETKTTPLEKLQNIEIKAKSESLDKAKQNIEEKDFEPVRDEQTAGESEKEKTQQENMQEPAKESKTSELNQDNPETKPTLEKQQLNIEEVKIFTLFTGNAAALQKPHKKFIGLLQNQIQTLREVYTPEESNVALIFCPAVSRVGTDINSALKRYEDNTGSKLAVLVVLHHTFDPEKVVPDSSRCVNRADILTVDCLFYEDTGLLECQKNSDAVDKVLTWLRQQEKKQETSGDNTQQMASTSSCAINYFVSVTGDAQDHHEHFINDVQKNINMKKVHTVQESDVILLFFPDITEYARKKDKPVVLISLHQTVASESVQKNNEFKYRGNLFPVKYIFHNGKGLLDCQRNKEEISDVVKFLENTKVTAF